MTVNNLRKKQNGLGVLNLIFTGWCFGFDPSSDLAQRWTLSLSLARIRGCIQQRQKRKVSDQCVPGCPRKDITRHRSATFSPISFAQFTG